MAHTKDFLLPDLGEGLTEGEIVSWRVTVGDTVEVDQPLAEIETAKAVVEVPAPFAGTIVTLHAEPGEVVEVGNPLVTINVTSGDSVDSPAETSPAEAATVPGDDESSGTVLVGYGTANRAAPSRRRRAHGQQDAARSPADKPQRPDHPVATPPVRKRARELGIDLADVPGTGAGGAITREDVEAFAARPGTPGTTPLVDDNSSAGSSRVAAWEDYYQLAADREQSTAGPQAPADLVTHVPMRGVRKAIAEKMTVSRHEIPEATAWVDCDATPFWRLREELNARQDDVRVSALALIMRACVAGLREFPTVNSRLDAKANEIVIHHFVNLGFAAQTPAGLIVPNIKRADRLSTLGIAQELNRLASAARERSVQPHELTGGTFTVSNYGSFGVDGGSVVINYPEAAILGVGRINDRPWLRNGKKRVRKVVQLSIAFDHRICDGADAAGFLRFIADCVETPATLLANL